TANLDFGNQSRVLHEIGRLRAEGIAILLCSHDPDHAFQVADQVLLLDKGRALAQGSVEQALTTENLSRLYGVAVRVVQIEADGARQRVCVPVSAAEGLS
ncbi:MAG TPA: hypothetical protein VN878_01210, partial [Usitatibacter sp.]|nr:hypothetical protein [Usitatibacter sp.]